MSPTLRNPNVRRSARGRMPRPPGAHVVRAHPSRAAQDGPDRVRSEGECWNRASIMLANRACDARVVHRRRRRLLPFGPRGDARARKRIMLIGWDFDARIDLDRRTESCTKVPRRSATSSIGSSRRSPELEGVSVALGPRSLSNGDPRQHDLHSGQMDAPSAYPRSSSTARTRQAPRITKRSSCLTTSLRFAAAST